MGLVAFGAAAVIFYCAERITTRARRAKAMRHRGEAEYPTTGNDPLGRTVV